MWQSASTWVWQSPCAAMPSQSRPNRTLLPSTATSCPWTANSVAGMGLSGPATRLTGMAMDTRRPERTSAAASRTFSGVIKLSVPSWSSGPQRPQFLTDSKISSNSATLTFDWVSATRPHLLRSWTVDAGDGAFRDVQHDAERRAAVDDEVRPGHVRGLVGGEEEHRVGDLDGLSEAAERHALQVRGARDGVVHERRREAGVHDPGQHAVHPDAVLAEVERGVADERPHAALRGAVVRGALLDVEGVRGRCHDDRAPSSRGHLPRRLLHGVEDAAQVDAEHPFPGAVVDLEQRLQVADPGLGDEDVDAAEPLHAGLDRSPHVGASRHVAPDRDGTRRPSQLVRGTFRERLVDVEEDDPRALLDEPPGDRAAHALRGAGDERRPALEPARHHTAVMPPSAAQAAPVT